MLEKTHAHYSYPPKTLGDFIEERMDFIINICKSPNYPTLSSTLDKIIALQAAKNYLKSFERFQNHIYEYEAIKILHPMLKEAVAKLGDTEDRAILNALNDLAIYCQIRYDSIKDQLSIKK